MLYSIQSLLTLILMYNLFLLTDPARGDAASAVGPGLSLPGVRLLPAPAGCGEGGGGGERGAESDAPHREYRLHRHHLSLLPHHHLRSAWRRAELAQGECILSFVTTLYSQNSPDFFDFRQISK